MGVTKNIPYADIITLFRTACSQHLSIAAFETGTIDYLDASAVNRLYPYIFLRPMGSKLGDRVRTLSFELYSLDQPTIATQDNVSVMSDTEIYIYDLMAWFNYGPAARQQVYEFTVNSITPVNEAFQDRLYGWMAQIDISSPWDLDFCNYPSL